MLKRKCAGQSIAEYAVVLGIVIAAVVAMQIYVKRQLQGKMKGAVDFVPGQGVGGEAIFTSTQFEPNYTTSEMDISRSGSTKVATAAQGVVTRTLEGDQTSSRTGTQSTAEY